MGRSLAEYSAGKHEKFTEGGVQGSGRRREENSKKRKRDSSDETSHTNRKSARRNESSGHQSARKRDENDSRKEENGRIKENWRRSSHRSEGRYESGQRKNDSSQREERAKGRDREMSMRRSKSRDISRHQKNGEIKGKKDIHFKKEDRDLKRHNHEYGKEQSKAYQKRSQENKQSSSLSSKSREENDVKQREHFGTLLPKEGGNVKEDVKRNADGTSSSVERHQPSSKEECGRGSIKEHENWDGPVCPKCGQICKDRNGLRNHVLSHYYEIIFEVLPSSAPFSCPECGKVWRDKFSLARHYAYSHNMLYELTDVTPEMLDAENTKNQSCDIKFGKGGYKKEEATHRDTPSNRTNPEKREIKSEVQKQVKLEKEDLNLKESVAALSVKSDGNFVAGQKSFGKSDGDKEVEEGKKRSREGETKEERRERREKRRMDKRTERKDFKVRDGCEDKNDAESKHFGRDAKTPVKSTQDFHSSTKNLMFEDETIRGGVGVMKMEYNIKDEFAVLPDPVYACKPECRCGFHY